MFSIFLVPFQSNFLNVPGSIPQSRAVAHSSASPSVNPAFVSDHVERKAAASESQNVAIISTTVAAVG